MSSHTDSSIPVRDAPGTPHFSFPSRWVSTISTSCAPSPSALCQKISLNRLRQGRVIQNRLLALVAGGPENLVHKITGIALTQLLLQCVADKFDKILDYVDVIRHLMFFGHATENLAELVV